MANEQTIANLIVRLSAQTVEMATGLKKAEGMLSSFRDTAQKVLGGISLAVVGYKLTAAITDAKNYAAELSKVAEKVGVPVKALSAMADAADDLGISLEQLAIGLKFLSRNMFEAAQGSGAAKEVFQALKVEYQAMPGVLRPLEETMLDLADIFSRMEDGPAKTAMALKLFGRSGIEMIPLLNKGRETLREWMKDAEATGKVIDESLGRKARELNRTIKNTKDAIQGISLTLMAELLPSLQAAAKVVLDLAVSMNRLRKDASVVVDAFRFLLLYIVPLSAAIVINANAIGIANLALRAFGATVAFLSTPFGWITAAIIALSALWTLLGRSTREAAKEEEKFADQVRSMKMDELQVELRETSRLLGLMKQKYEAMREELSQEAPFSLLSAGKAKELDDLQKAIGRTEERVNLLNKVISDFGKKKIQPPVFTPEEALKKLEGRLGQLRAEIIQLGDPVAGAKAALEAFIIETTRGVPITEKLATIIRQLRLEFGLYTALQQVRANVVAREKGDLAVSAAANEAAVAALKRNYDQGLVDISSYYRQRRERIQKGVQEEIDVLENEFQRSGTTEARKIEITAEIKVKRTKEKSDLAGELQDETNAVRDATFKQMGFQTTYLETVAAGRKDQLDQMEMQGAAELSALDAQHAAQLESIRTFSEERILLFGEYLSKEDALDRVQKAQIAARREKADAIERGILAQKLQNAQTVAAGMGDIFSQLYEMSGKKMKAFFILQKALAIAEIYIQAAIGAQKAIGQLGVFGIPMSTLIWAMAAANIAIVAAQTVMGMEKGGPVTKGSGRKDDVPAMLTRGEYVIPEPSVEYYGGPTVMEKIRRRIFPKDMFRGFGFFPVTTPQIAFAGGGLVTDSRSTAISVGPINVGTGDKAFAAKLRDEIESTVVRVLRDYSR